jgi:hypothetical protein
MTIQPQPLNNFCNLSREAVALLAAGQRRLLENRKRSRMPVDQRSLENLKRLEMAEAGLTARLKPGSEPSSEPGGNRPARLELTA